MAIRIRETMRSSIMKRRYEQYGCTEKSPGWFAQGRSPGVLTTEDGFPLIFLTQEEAQEWESHVYHLTEKAHFGFLCPLCGYKQKKYPGNRTCNRREIV